MSYKNQAINYGASTRSKYDIGYYNESVDESVGPFNYKLEPYQFNNSQRGLSVFGPRESQNGVGISTISGPVIAPRQAMVDVESILKNRNVPLSRTRAAGINNIDISKFKLHDTNTCSRYLDPIATYLTNPSYNYRELSVNRFYSLDRPIQQALYWDKSVNTQLEARDNYKVKIPKIMDPYSVLPKADG